MTIAHQSSRTRRLHHGTLGTVAATVLLTASCAAGGSGATDPAASAAADPAAATPDSSEAGPDPEPAVDPYTLRIGTVDQSRSISGVLGYADEHGILERHLAPVGAEEIEFILFDSGPPAIAALENGDVDFIRGGDVPAVSAAAEGLDSRLVQFGSVGSDTWLLGQPDGPTEVAGLAGLTVAALPGTTSERFLLGVLAEEGLVGREDVEIADLSPVDAVAALEGGQVDAISAIGTNAARLESAGYLVLARSKDYPSLGNTSTIAALASFLDEHPGLAPAFNAAWTETVELIHDDFDAFLEWESDVTEQPVDRLARIAAPEDYPTEAFPDDGVELLENTVSYLVEFGFLEQPFDVNGWLHRE